VTTVGVILRELLGLAIIIVIARFVIDWIQVLARRWRPKGLIAVLCEVIFSITDPPLRALRRVIPAVRIGNIMLDLSSILLLLGLILLQAAVILIFKV